jgi:putative nucleotidyltransferase with HDIG domain
MISALSYALDLTEGQPMGHSVRACIMGMRIGKQIGLPLSELGDLYYSLLLKDAGCSSNSSRLFHTLNADEIRAKGDVKTTDWTRVGWESLQYAVSHVATGRPFLERIRTLIRVAAQQQQESWELVKIRCDRGASVARKMGFSESVAGAIHSLDEHWNGRGYPDGLRGAEVPLFSRIMLLAQTLDVFLTRRSRDAAIEVARKRSGRWFDPELVSAAVTLAKSGALWAGLDSKDVVARAVSLEPEERSVTVTEDRLDSICEAFAEVIDAKSPFTYRHSNGVADAAIAIGRRMGLGERSVAFLRRTALLHDIGKLSVSNAILEKPDKPTEEEWAVIKKHPYYTLEILRKISGFEEFSEVAGSHHEKLDGTGYFRQLSGEQLTLPVRILVVADMFDALAANRPYRAALPMETVLEILQKETPHALDARCVEALCQTNPVSAPAPPEQEERPVAAGSSAYRR